MKSLVIFAATFICAQSLAYASSESSEEEYRVILTGGKRPLGLAGVGVVSQPVLQAVKVKVPRYANPSTKQLLISQALSARGISSEAQKSALVVRDRRQTAAGLEVVSVSTTEAGDHVASTVPKVPAVGGVTKVPLVAGVPVPVSKPN